ncbi:MAG: radical SAM protein [Candidatus Methanomethylophilaceae archaeon]
MEEDLIEKKAILLQGGAVQLPQGFQVPFRISRSTAGPGAGRRSIVFMFHGMRVKKSIVYEEGEFQLLPKEGGYALQRHGSPFLEDVEIGPVVFHSPEQAFFNLDQRCMYHCLYCNSPLLDVHATKGLSKEKIVQMTREAMRSTPVLSLAITSGVYGSVQETVERIADCVRHVRQELPGLPIGVEPYVETREQMELLHQAGADEIKINLETPNQAIFRKVCPDLDQGLIWRMLQDAVEVFGRGKVASNIIYGMRETDDDLLDTVERMASMGVAAGLRMLSLNDTNRPYMEAALGQLQAPSVKRMIRLAEAHKRILQRHRLDPRTFHTMCFACTCCDLVPFHDL